MVKPTQDEKTFTLYIAEVDSDGTTVRKIADLTSDFETIELVAKRKLRTLRAENKSAADAPAAPQDSADDSAE